MAPCQLDACFGEKALMVSVERESYYDSISPISKARRWRRR